MPVQGDLDYMQLPPKKKKKSKGRLPGPQSLRVKFRNLPP